MTGGLYKKYTVNNTQSFKVVSENIFQTTFDILDPQIEDRWASFDEDVSLYTLFSDSIFTESVLVL